MITKLNIDAIPEGSIPVEKFTVTFHEITQDKLISGENIKTINGESILGEGDITISGGGSSDANVQAVDTGDVLDDVTVDYATTAYVDNKVANINLTDYATITYVDGLVGDINSVLESIINGGENSIFPITLTLGDNGQTGIDLYNYVVQNSVDGYYAFTDNEIVTYDSGIVPWFNVGGVLMYTMDNGATLILNASGFVMINYSSAN